MTDRDMLEGYRDGLNQDAPPFGPWRALNYWKGVKQARDHLKAFPPSIVQAIREAVEEALREEPRT